MKVRRTIYSWKMNVIPSSIRFNKEPFILARYQEELGKDYKRITLFFDFQRSEGNFEEPDLSYFGDDDSDAPSSCNKHQKCEVEPKCSSDHNSSTQCDQFDEDQQLKKTHKLECED